MTERSYASLVAHSSALARGNKYRFVAKYVHYKLYWRFQLFIMYIISVNTAIYLARFNVFMPLYRMYLSVTVSNGLELAIKAYQSNSVQFTLYTK